VGPQHTLSSPTYLKETIELAILRRSAQRGVSGPRVSLLTPPHPGCPMSRRDVGRYNPTPPHSRGSPVSAPPLGRCGTTRSVRFSLTPAPLWLPHVSKRRGKVHPRPTQTGAAPYLPRRWADAGLRAASAFPSPRPHGRLPHPCPSRLWRDRVGQRQTQTDGPAQQDDGRRAGLHPRVQPAQNKRASAPANSPTRPGAENPPPPKSSVSSVFSVVKDASPPEEAPTTRPGTIPGSIPPRPRRPRKPRQRVRARLSAVPKKAGAQRHSMLPQAEAEFEERSRRHPRRVRSANPSSASPLPATCYLLPAASVNYPPPAPR
jgi:hypothetical protein